MKDVQITVADSQSNKQFKLNEVLTEISWSYQLGDQPGKLTFSFIENGTDFFYEGSNVVLNVDGKKIFDGYLFERNRTQQDEMSCVVYDRLRYLNNKDTFVFNNHSPNDIFKTICSQQQLPYRIVNGSTYKIPPTVCDNKTLYSMLTDALETSFIATKQYIICRDNCGTLELVDVANLRVPLLIGDSSLLTGFDFKSTIDSDVYNYIKLVQENENTGNREVYVTLDTTNMAKWGRLQYFEKVDKNANATQIKQQANDLLRLYNRKGKTLKLNAMGDARVREGCGVALGIEKLKNENIPHMQFALVSAVTHNISKEDHTMDLTMEVV
ncbi:MAG: hypothetical protein LBM65_07630 [Oscillospiraceae bacterium]|jgi:hypothetical protein|nr:hypothetical protein [Oscillospiraceae bacterium]